MLGYLLSLMGLFLRERTFIMGTTSRSSSSVSANTSDWRTAHHSALVRPSIPYIIHGLGWLRMASKLSSNF